MGRKALKVQDILVDTREQRPYWTSPPAEVVTLETGDYSVKGYSNRIRVERKSLADAFGSVNPNPKTSKKRREQFLRTFRRLSLIPYSCVVIEATVDEILNNPPEHTELKPAVVLGTYIKWGLLYGVPVYFVGGRTTAKQFTHNWMRLARDIIMSRCDGEYYHDEHICRLCGGGEDKVPHRPGCRGIVR